MIRSIASCSKRLGCTAVADDIIYKFALFRCARARELATLEVEFHRDMPISRGVSPGRGVAPIESRLSRGSYAFGYWMFNFNTLQGLLQGEYFDFWCRDGKFFFFDFSLQFQASPLGSTLHPIINLCVAPESRPTRQMTIDGAKIEGDGSGIPGLTWLAVVNQI